MRQHNKATFISKVLLFAFVALCSFQVGAQVSNFCWKDSDPRGVGTIPGNCPAGYRKEGALCYKSCPDGYTTSALGACIQTCPPGMRDDGAFCRKAEYHVQEYPWKFGDSLNDSDMYTRCRSDHGQNGCEKRGAVVVEKCKSGYSHVLGFCRPVQPDCSALGMGGQFDLSCTKKSVFKEPHTAQCGPGKVYDAGLCYNRCKSGQDGIGPVCWDQCSAKTLPFECAAGCAADEYSCGRNTADMVISVLDSAASIASTVATAGVAAGIKTGAKASAKAAVKTAGKASLKVMRSGVKNLKNVSKSVVKEIVKAQVKGVAVRTGVDAISYGSDAVSTAENISILVATAQDIENNKHVSQEEKDFLIAQQVLTNVAMFDPSGVMGVVAAYTKPKCSVLNSGGANPGSGAGTVEATLSNFEVYSNQIRVRSLFLEAELADKKADVKALDEQMRSFIGEKIEPLQQIVAENEKIVGDLQAIAVAPPPAWVDAAFTNTKGDTYLYFGDGTYGRISAERMRGYQSGLDSGYPIRMPRFHKNLPDGWSGGSRNINAILPYGSSGNSYIFHNAFWDRGGRYALMSLDHVVAPNYPRNFPGNWQGIPGDWKTVDAAMYWPAKDKHYLFNGSQYLRLSGIRVDPGYPKSIAATFKGMPPAFSSIDSATVSTNGDIYFFDDQQYVRFSQGSLSMDPGYPKPVVGVWLARAKFAGEPRAIRKNFGRA